MEVHGGCWLEAASDEVARSLAALAARVRPRLVDLENNNAYADAGKFNAITLRVNGGYNGKASRDAYYATARRVLGV